MGKKFDLWSYTNIVPLSVSDGSVNSIALSAGCLFRLLVIRKDLAIPVVLYFQIEQI